MEVIVREELERLNKLEPEIQLGIIEQLENDLNGPMMGYVYLTKYSTGYYGLGYAKNPTLRKEQLQEDEQQYKSNKITIELVHSIPTDDMVRLEKETAEIFNRHSKYIGDKLWELNQIDIDLFCSVKEGYYMRGYVYIIYVGHNEYKIGKTSYLERRFGELKEERLVRLIKAENITRVEGHLHKRFSNKRITNSQELFRLNDQDIYYIQTLPDEWEDESKIF